MIQIQRKKLLWNISLSLLCVRLGIRVHLNLLTHDNTSQKTEKLCVTGSLANLQPNVHELAWNSRLYMKSHEDFMHWVCLTFFISRQDSAWKQSQKYSQDQTKPIWDCFVKIRSCAKMSYIWKIFLCEWWSRFKEKRLLWNISWAYFFFQDSVKDKHGEAVNLIEKQNRHRVQSKKKRKNSIICIKKKREYQRKEVLKKSSEAWQQPYVAIYSRGWLECLAI